MVTNYCEYIYRGQEQRRTARKVAKNAKSGKEIRYIFKPRRTPRSTKQKEGELFISTQKLSVIMETNITRNRI